jgi:hypothetical protein
MVATKQYLAMAGQAQLHSHTYHLIILFQIRVLLPLRLPDNQGLEVALFALVFHLHNKRYKRYKMAKLNSEFNYRYQVIGETLWAKIQTLHGFLDGRKRAAVLEQVADLKQKAKYLELEHLKSSSALPHVILELEADIIEMESFFDEQKRNFELNKQEIKILERYLAECYELAEPTRLTHSDGTKYSDEEMFEVNAANEFTLVLAREMQAEIISGGRPSAAKIKNAMSNPITWQALKNVGVIPADTLLIAGSIDPTNIQLTATDDSILALEHKQTMQSITKKQATFS